MSELPMIWQYVVAGIAGAVARICLVEHGRIVLFRVGRTQSGSAYLDLGFVSSLFLGVAAAIWVDKDWRMAFLGALAAPYILEGLPTLGRNLAKVAGKDHSGKG